MKKFNVLYVFWFAALVIFIWLLSNLKTQVTKSIFGTATTQVYSMNVEYAAVVKEKRVLQGDRVKKGDTLLILLRTEMDKNISEMLAIMNQYEVEKDAKNSLIDKEEELYKTSQQTRKTEIEAQIRIIEKEIEIQTNLLLSIGEKKSKTEVNIKELELAALKESLNQLNKQSQQQHISYNTERESNTRNYEAKLVAYKNNVDYYQLEKFKMIIVSPVDGIVENVFVLPKDLVQEYKELVRINSITPNRVTGFVHEGTNAPYNIGDSVMLSSVARPEFKTTGIIIGTGNNLVELPLRLRKIVELRAWGREIYIGLPPENEFYIDEKILIQIK